MVEDAVSVSVVVVQVSNTGADTLALGTVIFCVTVTDAVAVHPFTGFVTVTVYVAGDEMVLVAVVTPPPQLKVAPPVVDDALNISLRVVQFNTVGAATLALGAVRFWLTVVDAVLVQPLPGSVTVTV